MSLDALRSAATLKEAARALQATQSIVAPNYGDNHGSWKSSWYSTTHGYYLSSMYCLKSPTIYHQAFLWSLNCPNTQSPTMALRMCICTKNENWEACGRNVTHCYHLIFLKFILFVCSISKKKIWVIEVLDGLTGFEWNHCKWQAPHSSDKWARQC